MCVGAPRYPPGYQWGPRSPLGYQSCHFASVLWRARGWSFSKGAHFSHPPTSKEGLGFEFPFSGGGWEKHCFRSGTWVLGNGRMRRHVFSCRSGGSTPVAKPLSLVPERPRSCGGHHSAGGHLVRGLRPLGRGGHLSGVRTCMRKQSPVHSLVVVATGCAGLASA